VGTSLPVERLIRVLEQVVTWGGRFKALRLDNELGLDRGVLHELGAEQGVELRYIQPGNPYQNAFIERFNRMNRTKCSMSMCLNRWTSEWLHRDRFKKRLSANLYSMTRE
jgi:transposase InsO family protein